MRLGSRCAVRLGGRCAVRLSRGAGMGLRRRRAVGLGSRSLVRLRRGAGVRLRRGAGVRRRGRSAVRLCRGAGVRLGWRRGVRLRRGLMGRLSDGVRLSGGRRMTRLVGFQLDPVNRMRRGSGVSRGRMGLSRGGMVLRSRGRMGMARFGCLDGLVGLESRLVGRGLRGRRMGGRDRMGHAGRFSRVEMGLGRFGGLVMRLDGLAWLGMVVPRFGRLVGHFTRPRRTLPGTTRFTMVGQAPQSARLLLGFPRVGSGFPGLVAIVVMVVMSALVLVALATAFVTGPLVALGPVGTMPAVHIPVQGPGCTAHQRRTRHPDSWGTSLFQLLETQFCRLAVLGIRHRRAPFRRAISGVKPFDRLGRVKTSEPSRSHLTREMCSFCCGRISAGCRFGDRHPSHSLVRINDNFTPEIRLTGRV